MTATNDSSAAADAPSEEATREKRHRLRHTIGILCLIVSVVIAPLAIATTWVKNELLNTDRYVSTVAPLADNQALTDYVATRVTNELTSSVNIDSALNDALPPRLKQFSSMIASGADNFIEQTAKTVLASDQFKTIWKEANRNAHELVNKALTGQGKQVELQNGKVVLDLSQVLIAVKTKLSQRGLGIFDKLPIGKTAIRFQLFDAKGLEQARTAVRLLVIVRWILVILTFALAGVGIFLLADRRRAFAQWGLGLALSLGIVGAIFLFFRGYALDHLPADGPPQDVAKATIDQMTYYLRMSYRAGILAGLLIAIGATLAGPGRAATRFRTIVKAGVERSPAPNAGPFPKWVYRYRVALRVAGGAVVLVAVLAGITPNPGAVIVTVILLLIWFAAIEILGRAGAPVADGDVEPTPA